MKNLLIMSLFLAVTSLALSAQAAEPYQCVDSGTGQVLYPAYEYRPTASEEENIKSMDTIMQNCLSFRDTRFDVTHRLFKDIDDNGNVIVIQYDKAECIQKTWTAVADSEGYILPDVLIIEDKVLASNFVENPEGLIERSRELSKLLGNCLAKVELDIQRATDR